ncbi:single-stranded DNA-binding protein [uncultured Sneathia sp.]|uniref:single-stranded DNA-binding protein n=1 Tax=uncultured Sneathia sp. TaxID=278067 RepID=UPI002592C498|nr:single-stranded DNA-binding protein [uncultured Sneathia sp.]
MGRLTKAPELKYTNTGTSYCNFTLAVNKPKMKDKEQETNFINCTAWNKTAETICNWLEKGNRVVVLGRLDVSKKDDKYYTNVVVETINFIDTVRTSKEQQNTVLEAEVIEDDNEEEDFPF